MLEARIKRKMRMSHSHGGGLVGQRTILEEERPLRI